MKVVIIAETRSGESPKMNHMSIKYENPTIPPELDEQQSFSGQSSFQERQLVKSSMSDSVEELETCM